MRRDDVASTSLRRHFTSCARWEVFSPFLQTENNFYGFKFALPVLDDEAVPNWGKGIGCSKTKKKKKQIPRGNKEKHPIKWELKYCKRSRPRGYKTFFVLNSVEHEILNAHKYKNIKKFGIFKVHVSLECYFSRSYMLKCQQLLAF